MMHRCWRGQVCERAPPATVRRLSTRAPVRQAQALLDGCVARNALRVPFQPRLVVRQANRRQRPRSEEHTSELQSLMRISYAVFCLKKKKKITSGNTKEAGA